MGSDKNRGSRSKSLPERLREKICTPKATLSSTAAPSTTDVADNMVVLTPSESGYGVTQALWPFYAQSRISFTERNSNERIPVDKYNFLTVVVPLMNLLQGGKKEFCAYRDMVAQICNDPKAYGKKPIIFLFCGFTRFRKMFPQRSLAAYFSDFDASGQPREAASWEERLSPEYRFVRTFFLDTINDHNVRTTCITDGNPNEIMSRIQCRVDVLAGCAVTSLLPIDTSASAVYLKSYSEGPSTGLAGVPSQ